MGKGYPNKLTPGIFQIPRLCQRFLKVLRICFEHRLNNDRCISSNCYASYFYLLCFLALYVPYCFVILRFIIFSVHCSPFTDHCISCFLFIDHIVFDLANKFLKDGENVCPVSACNKDNHNVIANG